MGIDTESIPKIFDEFEQEDLTTIKQYKGWAWFEHCKKIGRPHERKHHLSIQKRQEGQLFSIELPLKVEAVTSASQKNISDDRVDLNLNILVVDDSEDNLTLMERYFSKTQCNVDFINNGLDAFEQIKANNYDLVLMDIQMPKLDGFETTKMIRAYELEQNVEPTKIVALSAHVNKTSIDQMMDSGCNDHLAKPIKKRELFKFINEEFGGDNSE